MDYIKQTWIEIKNIFTSKFLLILGILVMLMSIAMPVLSAVSGDPSQASSFLSGGYSEGKYDYYDAGTDEAIVVDGVTIEPDNPFYWNIKQFEDEQNYMNSSNFQHPEAYDLVMEMGQMERDYYLRFAKQVTSYKDYRSNLAWQGSQSLYDKYIYEHNDVDLDTLKEALNWRRGVDETTFETTYIKITPEQREAGIQKAEEKLERIFKVVEDNDFAEYIAISIEQDNAQIEDMNKQIDALQTNIADLETQKAAAEQEYNNMVSQNADTDALSQQTAKIENLQMQIKSIQDNIDSYKKNIQTIQDVSIPMLQYRLDNNIVPNDGSWQDTALTSKESSMSQLAYTTIVTEEQFNSQEYQYLKDQYGTYANYTAEIQKQIDELNKNVIIAEQSLESGKPDMSFVPDGARSQTANFLYFSVFVALLAVVIGGWLMASEFQFGTIRLLMIRPKTRTKIYTSKFLSGLVLCLGIYIAGALINLILNGILFGFGDFANPNYSVGGQIGFFGYYLPKFFACMITILFGYCVAFLLSTVVKNIAVAISVPIVLFIGCFIAMSLFSPANGGYYPMAYASYAEPGMGSGMPAWVAYTPLPYVQISSFFVQNSAVNLLINSGAPISLGYGLGLLSGLSVICALIPLWVFKKRDITN